MDGITDLSCKNGITHYGVDGGEPTHNLPGDWGAHGRDSRKRSSRAGLWSDGPRNRQPAARVLKRWSASSFDLHEPATRPILPGWAASVA